MNEQKAKRIRKKVYGEMSIRNREYTTVNGQVVCKGLRAKYQEAKKG